MNREYRKFNAPAEEFIPPATEPGHFSHLPDVLIPEDYHEPPGNPLEKDVADLIRESITPPPTPPELEPGRAGCYIFRDSVHYVDPIYQDPEVRRVFTTKLSLGSLFSLVPTMLTVSGFMIFADLDFLVLNNPKAILITWVVSVLGVILYIYFVGLFRNPPYIYIAVAVRLVLNTSTLTSGMLLVHTAFLNIVGHGRDEQEEYNITHAAFYTTYDTGHQGLDYSPPYLSILIVLLVAFVKGIITVLLLKYNYTMDHYAIPFVIYTTCYSASAILVTIVLNDGFGYQPAYDIFQVITGCFIASTLLIRTPTFIERLYEGKVCPLREGELLYALIHFGL